MMCFCGLLNSVAGRRSYLVFVFHEFPLQMVGSPNNVSEPRANHPGDEPDVNFPDTQHCRVWLA